MRVVFSPDSADGHAARLRLRARPLFIYAHPTTWARPSGRRLCDVASTGTFGFNAGGRCESQRALAAGWPRRLALPELGQGCLISEYANGTSGDQRPQKRRWTNDRATRRGHSPCRGNRPFGSGRAGCKKGLRSESEEHPGAELNTRRRRPRLGTEPATGRRSSEHGHGDAACDCSRSRRHGLGCGYVKTILN